MSDVIFTESDIRQIEKEGLTIDQVLKQIDLFKRGVFPVKLIRPCKINDGIITIPEENLNAITALHEEEARKGRMIKFVPASGAASRMFRDWYIYLEKDDIDSVEGEGFSSDLRKFAFFSDLSNVILREGEHIEKMIEDKRYADIMTYILTSKGLNYGNLPKALLKFHTYPNGSRTALEEHLVEASLYTKGACHVCRVHFTVSEEHQEAVNDYLSQVKKDYEKYYGVKYDITISNQKSSTNTMAVDLRNCPFRDQQGNLVFRPGGHGALLENLNSIDGDIIYLKNIDNVVPDRLKPVTTLYKKALGGYLVFLQNEIFKFLHIIGKNEVDNDAIVDMISFCESKLNIIMPAWFEASSFSEKCTFINRKLDRPIRVCGMVKNEGEPGGGPFWVNGVDGTQSLQIIEESQVDLRSPEQKAIWSSATHFNPVDLVCGVRDYQSGKFNLHEFVDPNSYFISQKSERGRDLRALELPGLWNGAMAFWNTVFVEVPVETFNPVKTVRDLLRQQHMS